MPLSAWAGLILFALAGATATEVPGPVWAPNKPQLRSLFQVWDSRLSSKDTARDEAPPACLGSLAYEGQDICILKPPPA